MHVYWAMSITWRFIRNPRKPRKHTTSFRCPYNAHNVKTTSHGCQNNVVCVLGSLSRTSPYPEHLPIPKIFLSRTSLYLKNLYISNISLSHKSLSLKHLSIPNISLYLNTSISRTIFLPQTSLYLEHFSIANISLKCQTSLNLKHFSIQIISISYFLTSHHFISF